MLDTRQIHTTNIKMKFLNFFGGFLLLTLCLPASQADISLKLRNKQYLSPPIQEQPINENYYNKQEKTQPQEKFAENSYGTARYRIYEVHNHYQPSTRSENKQKPLGTQVNSAKSSANQIRIEHINAPAGYPLDDPNLDASYLSFAAGNDDANQQIIVQHQTENNIPVPFPSNFRHHFPEKSSKKNNYNDLPKSFASVEKYHSQEYGTKVFKAPEYLPPKFPTQEYLKQPDQKSVAQQQYQNTHKQDHTTGNSNSEDKLNYSLHARNYNNEARFKGPDYLPPRQNSAYKGPDYLPPRQQNSNPTQLSFTTHGAFRGPDYLPPKPQNSLHSHRNFEHNSAFENSNNLPANQHGSDQSEKSYSQNPPFKGPDYLPPSPVSDKQRQSKQFRPSEQFRGPEYLPPGNSQDLDQNSKISVKNALFRGPDYLPPQRQAKQANYQANQSFKGPDYLPPHQSRNNSPFKGPDYLPPSESYERAHQTKIQNLPAGYDFGRPNNAEQAIEELHKLPEDSTKSQIQITGNNESPEIIYGTPQHEESGTLPPGYDFQKPENSEQAIKLLHSQDPRHNPKALKDSKTALPIYHFQRTAKSEKIDNQFQNVGSTQQHFSSESDNAVSSLSTGNNSQNPGKQVISELHRNQNSFENNKAQAAQSGQTYQTDWHQSSNLQQNQVKSNLAADYTKNFQSPQGGNQFSQTFKGPDYLPPSVVPQTFKGPEYLPPISESQTFKESDPLSPSSVPKTFKSSDYSSSGAAFKGPEYLPPTTGTQVYKGPDYLPPVNTQRTVVSSHTQSSTAFKGPDYLPPENVPQFYHTTAETPLKVPGTIPLSRYMADVKPDERYGSRRPFPEYGLPPAKPTSLSTGNTSAPNYRELTSRPEYYAPKMSYSNNAFRTETTTTFTANKYETTSTLSQQARQALQAFMPKDLQPAPPTTSKSTTTLQAPKAAKAKIRTVQIVNPNAVKTLKVLESLDEAGVKTIKILGPSNEPPMGDHRVVKVVSGNHEQSIQTVKIFNDHQDVTTAANDASTGRESNSYLPPRRKRSSINEPKAK